ncbi:thioredoxin domain-containing protein, partial [Escherichia coli]|nr:thioredoxin domain-containing protein [Escherichia coli]
EFISANNDNKLVVCLCADWCNSCNDWKNPLIALSEKYRNDFFIWMDIERHSDMVSDVDLDTLPVLLVQKNNDIIFLGAVVPRVNTIIPLLET